MGGAAGVGHRIHAGRDVEHRRHAAECHQDEQACAGARPLEYLCNINRLLCLTHL